MKRKLSGFNICALFILCCTTVYSQTTDAGEKEKQKDKEETAKWILQKLNSYTITDYKMTYCDKSVDAEIQTISHFTYDYSENSLTWSLDEAIKDEPNVHKITTYKFYIKYYDDVAQAESIETITFNKKCLKKRNSKTLHLTANGNFIEATSFYYRRQLANQFDKTTLNVKKIDINFKYDAEDNLAARLGKAFKHLKELVSPATTPVSTDHKSEKF